MQKGEQEHRTRNAEVDQRIIQKQSTAQSGSPKQQTAETLAFGAGVNHGADGNQINGVQKEQAQQIGEAIQQKDNDYGEEQQAVC